MSAAALAESCSGRNRLFTSKRKYAWERLCDGNFRPAPSMQGYTLDPVVGVPELMNGGGGEPGIEMPDDYTLVVNLRVPFADFDAAGYPLGEDGSRGLSLTVSCASSSVNTNILSMVQTDLAACGVDLQIQTLESAAYMNTMQPGDFQIGRSGMTTLVPTPYQVLQVLFYTGTGDNYSGYSNAIVAENFSVIPLFFLTLNSVVSNRVNNLYLNPISFARLMRCWLSA